ncbi:MAG: hypothetical protein KGZ39_00675 [Simkania sp.]|nr:hypothetical protein [Simkania sp.]
MSKYFKKIKDLVLNYLKDPLLLKKWDQPDYYRVRGRGNNDNQLSVRTTRNRRHRYHYYGTSSMLIEDMFTGIMPFMIYRGVREKYPATTIPSSPEKEAIIAQGLSGRRHRTALGEGLCDFVRDAAHTLFLDGVALYEIIYKKNEAGEIESYNFELLQPFEFFRFFGNYYQFISWREAKASHTKVQIIKIPKEKILRIDFPKKFGGKRRINKILKRSWKLGQEIIPEFQMKAMEKQENTGFNANEYADASYLEIATLTKDLGWNQRQLSTNHTTEYYALLRLLRQRKVEATVRELIFAKLNEVLNGPVLNFGVQVSMDNLFSVADIEARVVKLKEGNVTFVDLFTDTSL